MTGPRPIQLVVVIAVAKAVSAATNIFTAISIKRFFIGYWLRDYTIIGIVVTAAGVSTIAARVVTLVVTALASALRVVAAWRSAEPLPTVTVRSYFLI